MAIETSYILRASAVGFEAAGRAIDDLNRKAEKGQEKIRKIGDEAVKVTGKGRRGGRQQGPLPGLPGGPRLPGSRPGAGPAIIPGASAPLPGADRGGLPGLGPAVIYRPGSSTPFAPDPRLNNARDDGFGPAYDPQDLPPVPGAPAAAGGAAGGGKRKRRKPLPLSAGVVAELEAAYNKATAAAVRLGGQASDNNAIIAAGLPDIRAYAEAIDRIGRRRGGRAPGGGGGGAAGGGGAPPGPPGSAPPEPTPGKKDKTNQAAFLQGFLEALTPGIGMIQRGKGAMAQYAGRSIGGFASAAGRMPFSGLGGVQGLIASTPLIGGALNPLFATQYGQVGGAIGFEQQQQQNLPYLGRTGVRRGNLRDPGGAGGMSFRDVGTEGMRRLGMNAQSSQQYLAALARSSGTTADDGRIGAILGQSMNAMGAYGIGPEVAGAYVQGERLQGFGRGVGQQGFLSNMAQANQGLGLNGAELVDYMREMAENIASFRQTGIPIATDSIGALGTSLKETGIAGSRAGFLAGNFQRNAQDVGMRGPQNSDDFALLQAAAGHPLTGIDDTLEASEQLEQGQSPDQAQRTFRNLLAFAKDRYGNDRSGQFRQRQFLSRYGVRLNSKEFRNLGNMKQATLNGGQLSNFIGATAAAAEGNVSSAVAGQAGLDNQGLRLGMEGLVTYFKSESFQKNLASGVTEGLNPFVNKVVDAIEGFTSFITGGRVQASAMAPRQAAGRR